MPHKLSKSKLIKENRDARLVLDLIAIAVKQGNMDHVFSLKSVEYDTKKVDGIWITETKSKQMTISQIDEMVVRDRKHTLEILDVINTQLVNYNKLLLERDLVESKPITENNIRIAEEKIAKRDQHSTYVDKSFKAKKMELDEQDKLKREEKKRLDEEEYQHLLRIDGVYAISQKYLSKDSYTDKKMCEYEIRKFLELNPEHPKGKIGMAINYFVNLQDRLIVDERFRLQREQAKIESDKTIAELEKKYTAKPIRGLLIN